MAIRVTSIAAYRDLVDSGKADNQSARIIKLVANRKNRSMQEIMRDYRANYGNIELSTVSARVNELKKSGVFAEDNCRKCSITKITINPVMVAAGG